MSIFDLILENPTLQNLANKFSHLRKYLELGFETDRRFHANNAIGIVNSRQVLRVNLDGGEIIPII